MGVAKICNCLGVLRPNSTIREAGGNMEIAVVNANACVQKSCLAVELSWDYRDLKLRRKRFNGNAETIAAGFT